MTTEMNPPMDLQQAINERRAARAFTGEPISDVTLEAILRMGTQAPSGFNLQPWRFIVVRTPNNREKLQECAFNQRQVGEAPVILICCGDRAALNSDNIESVIRLGEQNQAINDQYANYMRNNIPGFAENAPSFGSTEVWTNRHTMLAVAQMMLVAKSYGIDSCPMEGFVTAQVKTAFNIPDNVDVCCLLALGYAQEPYKQYGGRFHLQQVCYGESYGESFGFGSSSGSGNVS